MPNHGLNVACDTHVGRQRSENEDTVDCGVIDDEGMTALLVLADGMGGPAGGAEASSTAVTTAYDSVVLRSDEINEVPADVVEAAIRDAHQAVQKQVHDECGLPEAGCTLVVAVVLGTIGEVVVGNIGDSRAYTLIGEELDQLTTDQSYVQQLVAEGEIDPADAEDHPLRHVLAQALGTADALDVAIEQVTAPDRLLLCSDGLSGYVSESLIADRLIGGSPEESCQDLIEAANANGGEDNIGVAIVDIEAQPGS